MLEKGENSVEKTNCVQSKATEGLTKLQILTNVPHQILIIAKIVCKHFKYIVLELWGPNG